MKVKSFILIIISIPFISFSSFKIIQTDYTKMLIGSWTYIESRDEQGKKIQPDDAMRTLMNEPNLVYESNFTYRKIFTPESSDTGKWKFNAKTMTIEHDLFIDSTDFVGKDLIKQGLAIKQKDGKYYEENNDKVMKLMDNELIIDRYGMQIVYKKD
jgi:hypothetical protein